MIPRFAAMCSVKAPHHSAVSDTTKILSDYGGQWNTGIRREQMNPKN